MPWLSSVAGRVRGVVPGPGGRHRDRRPAVRRRQPVRAPAGDLPRRRCPRSRRTPRRSGRAPTAPCSTPRASTSATAGTTRNDSRRCSRSATACRTPSFSFSNLSVGVADRGRRRHGHRDRDQHRLPGRRRRRPALRHRPGRRRASRRSSWRASRRVNLAAGASTTVSLPAHAGQPAALEHRHATPGPPPPAYGIPVGDSAANLPLTGTLRHRRRSSASRSPSPTRARRRASRAPRCRCRSPRTTPPAARPCRSPRPGCRPGSSISSGGTITGTPTTAGTSPSPSPPRTATARRRQTTFVWTVAPGRVRPCRPRRWSATAACAWTWPATSNANGTKVDVYTCNGTDGAAVDGGRADGTVRADGQVPRRDESAGHRQRHAGRPLRLQRHRRPGLAAAVRTAPLSTRSPASAWTTRAVHDTGHPGADLGLQRRREPVMGEALSPR